MRKVAEPVAALKDRMLSLRSRMVSRAAALILAAMVISAVLSPLIFVAALPGLVWAAPTYPNAVGNVNDFAKVLSVDDKANLDALIDSVLEQTGAVFAVAVLEDHGDESLEVYGVKLFEKWGIGEKGKDNGLLLLLTMAEHDVRMEVGYGLEAVVTDRRAGESLDKMIPYFKNDEYGKGLYAGLLNAAQYVAKDAGVDLNIKPATKDYEAVARDEPSLPLGLIGAAISIPLLLATFFGLRGHKCPKCKSRMTVTDRVVQGATYDAGGMALKIYHCPRCGYHDEKPFRTSRLTRPGAGMPPIGPGPFFGGFGRGGKGGGGGFSGPRGFGGGRSGGGGAGRKW
ncbi:MAG: TPM domain-containing protein [Bacillota bacterium]